jgi:hypothetical protein
MKRTNPRNIHDRINIVSISISLGLWYHLVRQVENSIQPWFCLEWWKFYKGLITTICSPSSTYGSHTKFKCCLSPSLPIYVKHLTHLHNSTYFPHLICLSFHICSMLITSAIIQVVLKMNLHNNNKRNGLVCTRMFVEFDGNPYMQHNS